LEATNFLKEYHEKLVTTNILLYSNSNRETMRGLLLLPEKIDENFIRRPDAFHLDKKLCLHMSCLNVKSKNRNNFVVVKFFKLINKSVFFYFFIIDYFNTNVTVNYSHMLDVKGIPMQKQFYDINFMVLVIASSYLIANSSVSTSFLYQIK